MSMSLEQMVRAFAETGGIATEGDCDDEYCISCSGSSQWIAGYDGPLEVPAEQRKAHHEFVHDDDCAWVAADEWARVHPDYDRGRALGCPECDAEAPHDCIFIRADKLHPEDYRAWALARLREQLGRGEELTIGDRRVWYELARAS